MDAAHIIQILLVLVTAVSPFVLKNINVKGPGMAWFSFGVSSLMAALAMLLGGSFNAVTWPLTPEQVVTVFAAFWALQQGVYSTLKDRFLL